jgi:ribosomal protein L5
MAAVSIGNDLKDSFKETSNWVNNNIQFLTDVEQFYRQRSQIEKEYASQLQKLSAEYLRKKANKTTNVSVGDEPKFTPGSLESATMVSWTDILSKTETLAKNHDTFGNELGIKVADHILSLQRSLDAMQQRLIQFHSGTLLKKKDEVFDQVAKAKKEYDDTCISMESTRARAEKSGNKDKYQKKYHDKETDMNIAKNNYLLKISIANRIKDKFYYQDLPEVLDLLQDVNEFKTIQMNKILAITASTEINKNNKNIKALESTIELIKENKPQLDTAMFIKHNLTEWQEPQDFYYVPSSIWHDDDHFVAGESEVQVLKRTLALAHKTQSKLDDAIESEREKLNSLTGQKTEMKNKEGDEFDFKLGLNTVNGYLTTLSQFVVDENMKVAAQVEIETIGNNVGDKDLSIDNLTITTKKRGFFSRLKGQSAQKQVVQEASPDVFDDTRSVLSSQTTKSHHSSHFKLGSLLRPRKASESSQVTTSLQATALYPYEAQGDDELSLQAGESFAVITTDDGSGWTEVNLRGSTGLVPTSYIQVNAITTEKKKGPEVTPRKGAKKVQYCVAKFSYNAEEPNELTIAEGDRIEIIKGDDGGWTLGEISGRSGLFPTSYVELE